MLPLAPEPELELALELVLEPTLEQAPVLVLLLLP